MTSRLTRHTAVASVLLVAMVAAVVSYAHMHDLAMEHGESWRSVLIPLAVDGMLVAATLAIVDRRRHRQPAGVVPWLGLTLGIVASLAANVAAARPELVAQLIAAWPPVALAVSIETLVIVLRTAAEQASEAGADWVTGGDESPVSGRTEGAELDAEPSKAGPEGKEMGRERGAWLVSARNVAPPAEAQVTGESEPVEPDPVAELLAAGAGRRRVSRALGVSEHEARKLLDERRNGAAR
ncbi:MAG: DUF2637 domain-containing protein [Pseudonocardiaceae bacterium]